jgi:hypothetical protein
VKLSSDKIKFWFLFAISLIFGFAITFPFWWKSYGKPPVTQPFAFNHKIHLENDMKCAECHEGVNKEIFAGIPNTETCALCHDPPAGEGKLEGQFYKDYIEKNKKINWQRISRQPDHVFFSHRRHVVLAEISCERCHGKMGERMTPPKRPEVFLDMGDCIDCHQQSNVQSDCTSCHK